MTFSTPNTHIAMYNGTTTAGELVVPWSLPTAQQISDDYENDQNMLAIHACGNLYAMNGRGSGPTE